MRLQLLDVSLVREYLLHALRPAAFLARHVEAPPSLCAAGEDTAVGCCGAAVGSGATDATGGWRASEYRARFGGDFDAAKLRALCVAHVRGLAWCAHYYYHGCADWRWHFGFHYAPYAHDLAAVAAELAAAADGPWAGGAAGDVAGGAAGSESIGAWGGEGPLRPVQQLAAVLPPSSAALLPASYRPLVCSGSSPLAAYYPRDVPLDSRGCAHLWQAVPLLPFLPITALLRELAPLPLTAEEARHDAVGRERLYAHPDLARRVCAPPAVRDPEPHGPLEDGGFGARESPRPASAEAGWLALARPSFVAGSVRRREGGEPSGRQARAPLDMPLPPVCAGSFACFDFRPPKRRTHSPAPLPRATPLPPRLTLAELSAATRGKSTAEAAAAPAAASASAPQKRRKTSATAAELALARGGSARAQPQAGAGGKHKAPTPVDPGAMFGFTCV
ncbi:hypothetical protein EMIHUDRAFT_455347 [Emiliania huxleyi CCMP1516]|uniref:Xrn1 helical domain-containing protein n=2 Tax=Emiliania huxleyi TaxID=2903 RepID=A0A0D3KHM4_EMIH1|nr:hypothetical protein EMIHUDRAFT_455347 [Emiliania huxleyi CCMP1516]EOD35259.1 hypothetical protein EMIHUDRAFT_455347 [Emiliania huxleyi CCMP1516]|eukprot:XP_005787688.1 hypothetical protein EMIHUDRAFT_455347 [Emiliania huxleyi CCMP1516]